MNIGTRLAKLEHDFTTRLPNQKENNRVLCEINNTTKATKIITESCVVLQNKLEEEHKLQETRRECEVLIQGHTIPWKGLLKSRAISYWHTLQNYRKAELYREWIELCSEYLPLKYRV